MAINYKFLLKDTKSTKTTSIRLQFYNDGKRVVIGTGLEVYPELWNKYIQRSIISVVTSENEERNRNKYLINKKAKSLGVTSTDIKNTLKKLDKDLNKINQHRDDYLELVRLSNSAFDNDSFKTFMLEKIKPKKNKEIKRELIDYLEYFIHAAKPENWNKLKEDQPKVINEKKGTAYAIGTIKAYNNLYNKLKSFEQQKKKKLTFEKIDKEFYQEFKDWMYDDNKSPTYFGNCIKNLKFIMQRTFEENLHTSIGYKKFEVIKGKKIAVALNQDEIIKLMTYDMSDKSEGYNKARDLFLIGCWTSLRIGDLTKLRANHIINEDGQLYLNLITRKTDKEVMIPLHPDCKNLLEKYDNTFVGPDGKPILSINKCNEYIKQIAEKAKLYRLVQVREEKGRLASIKEEKLCDIISFHVARKTAATMMYNDNAFNLEDVSMILGHSSVEVTRNYLDLDSKKRAKELAMSDFFKPIDTTGKVVNLK